MIPRPLAVLSWASCLAAASALRSRQETGGRGGFNDPCTYITREPTLCTQGNGLWSDEELIAALPEFSKMYSKRPLKDNAGGVAVNHAFALWFTVRRLRPKYIIESGVHQGQTTYIMRNAAPNATMFSLDPREEGVTNNGPGQACFHDESPKTHYFRGKQFKDLDRVDWDSLIPKDERDQVFVALDDHMNCVRRSKELLRRGFLHLWYDDNFINGDTYSFNALCSARKPSDGSLVLMKDHFGTKNVNITLEQHQENLDWFRNHSEVYFEFPALFDGCLQHGRRRSLLDFGTIQSLGLPPFFRDWQHYAHYYSPYVKLRL